MPTNITLANEIWARYQYLRDNGHLDYVKKAHQCEDFFAGLQWDSIDLAKLKSQNRPALTINKIMSTIANVLGEQIFNRTDIAFKPRTEGATSAVADALTKVFSQISDNNQLPWVRSDVFCDGVVTSRGFYDVRLDFTDNLRGEVKITQLNPKNVLIDADADEYDPDTWNDVLITKWLTLDQIELVYSKKDADILRSRTDTIFPASYDDRDMRDRFGTDDASWGYSQNEEGQKGTRRNIRVIERQYKMMDKQLHFIDVENGDSRPVPTDWDEQRVSEYLLKNPSITTTKKLVQRIRWTVVADNVVLHDDWSPYKHFTVVPYFPYFRRGRTVGLVENLIGPQELLNKVSSQELHVVNTSANSGWIVRRNALQNMAISELEQRGAQTGLVIEVDDVSAIEKIQPNQTPSGLDRVSYKAEEHIKSISGVSDYMQGFAREDVAAKSVVANQKSGQANLAKVMDNMNRTDHMLAVRILDIVQEYYTEQRVLFITTDRLQNTTEQMTINEVTPEGTIVNDLTLGEYAVIVTNQPERDTFEDSQFEQALRLRTEVGVQIPDKYIIQASRLKDKAEIIQAMEQQSQSPEAQAQAQMQQRMSEAEAGKIEAETALKNAQAQKAMSEAAAGPSKEDPALKMAELEQQIALQREKMEQEFALKREQMEREFALKREQMMQEQALKQEQAEVDNAVKIATAAEQAKQARVAAVHNSAQPQGPAQPSTAKPAAPANPKPKE